MGSATNGLAFIDGMNTLKVVATTLSGETAESTAVCNYTSKITNVAAKPVITSPIQGENVSSVVKITGEVTFLSDSEKLENYTLEYKPYLDIIDYEKQLEYRDSDEGYKVLESGSVLENNELKTVWDDDRFLTIIVEGGH